MEDKNIKNIVIEDAETSKGSQLKNILILLALLFIILVVSIVITRLILGGDDNTDTAHFRADGTVQELGEHNVTGTVSEGLASASNGVGQAVAVAGAAVAGAAATTVALTSKHNDKNDNNAHSNTESRASTSSAVKTPLLAERNTSSKTKVPLRTEETHKSSTKHASTDSSTATKKATTRASSYTHRHSTYTRPKYIKKKVTTRTTTRATTTRKHSSKKVTRGYYIKVGAYANPSTAIRNIKAIKLNYKTSKTKNGLTRVLIGPFYSRRDAQNHLSKAKSNVAADAYIAKIK